MRKLSLLLFPQSSQTNLFQLIFDSLLIYLLVLILRFKFESFHVFHSDFLESSTLDLFSMNFEVMTKICIIFLTNVICLIIKRFLLLFIHFIPKTWCFYTLFSVLKNLVFPFFEFSLIEDEKGRNGFSWFVDVFLNWFSSQFPQPFYQFLLFLFIFYQINNLSFLLFLFLSRSFLIFYS